MSLMWLLIEMFLGGDPAFVKLQWSCLCFGDFNEIINPDESKGCNAISASMRRFGSFVDKAQLLDLPLHG